jgi:hypothetical protein
MVTYIMMTKLMTTMLGDSSILSFD